MTSLQWLDVSKNSLRDLPEDIDRYVYHALNAALKSLFNTILMLTMLFRFTAALFVDLLTFLF